MTRVPQQISDPISENLAKLSELFPAAVKDGALDVEALRAELGDFEEIRPGDETYELNWVGKKAAKKEAFKPLLGKTLALKGDGKDSATTQNLYIEGDNLEAMKLLRQNYYGEVKMIYIDPPYNTGNDFVYIDKFAVSTGESEEEEGAVTAEGKRLIKNEKTSNRFHARWLDMMYPRLKLAKDLLREDGVIFISIDDNEVANLRAACDEVFKSENFIAEIVWEGANKNTAQYIGVSHEYILVYSKNIKSTRAGWTVRKEDTESVLKEVTRLKKKYTDDYGQASEDLAGWFRSMKGKPAFSHRRFRFIDKHGAYKEDDPTAPGGRKYELHDPRDNTLLPLRKNRGWAFTQEEFNDMVEQGKVSFITKTSVMIRRYLHETDRSTPQSVIYQPARSASERLQRLMEGAFFDYPKDETVLQGCVEMASETNDLILDFFSGSATTAHAVMQLNAQDGGKRRFIMIQLPEACDEKSEAAKAGYQTIAEIGKERIRRAGEKIKEELKAKQTEWQKKQALAAKKGAKLALEDDATEETNPYVLDPDSLDIGFKSFRIEDTKINWLKKDLRGEQLEFSDTTTQDALDFVPGYTDTDVVYELMLRQSNIPLTGTITKPIATAKRTYLYADAYLVCLEEKITQKLVESLAAIEPTPNKYFFRDSAFGTDIALKDETFRRLKAEIHKHHGDLGAAYTVEFI